MTTTCATEKARRTTMGAKRKPLVSPIRSLFFLLLYFSFYMYRTLLMIVMMDEMVPRARTYKIYTT